MSSPTGPGRDCNSTDEARETTSSPERVVIIRVLASGCSRQGGSFRKIPVLTPTNRRPSRHRAVALSHHRAQLAASGFSAARSPTPVLTSPCTIRIGLSRNSGGYFLGAGAFMVLSGFQGPGPWTVHRSGHSFEIALRVKGIRVPTDTARGWVMGLCGRYLCGFSGRRTRRVR